MTVLRKQDGFTLTELIITMLVFILVIVAASNIFIGILGQFKQQSKIAESNLEGLIGLQMLRTDVEQAGFGLPWNLGTATYSEATNSGATTWDDTAFNDSPANAPRPIVFGSGGSDVLVVKATSIGTAQAAQRWTYITNTTAGNNPAVRWTPDTLNENLEDNDKVIVIKPVSGSRMRELVWGGDFFTTFPTAAYASATGLPGTFQSFLPISGSSDTHIIYGIAPSTTATLWMPFNRADYYVRNPGAGVKPSQCSADAGTGILYKATINHADGGRAELPLLDCVREMQIVFGWDSNPTDTDTSANSFGDLPAWTAENTRNQLKEVRIYILAHEGQRDTSYTSPAAITATDPDVGTVINFDAATAGLQNFRWKVYTIVAKPYSMR